MTLLIQALPELGESVLGRLRDAFRSSSDERISGLLPRIPSLSGPVRLVATGEYNAGKSSLLKALTGAEILIHSDVTTSEVHEYSWHHVLLVDTPGVKAGEALHDERAEEALRDADLVIFVITVDLFDDATAAHLRHVAFDLGKLEQMVIVVNKAATMSGAPGVRDAAVREVLGDRWSGALVECDARSSLAAATAPTPDRAAYLAERGNQVGLETALNELVTTQANIGRLELPFEAALAAVVDAQPFLVQNQTRKRCRPCSSAAGKSLPSRLGSTAGSTKRSAQPETGSSPQVTRSWPLPAKTPSRKPQSTSSNGRLALTLKRSENSSLGRSSGNWTN